MQILFIAQRLAHRTPSITAFAIAITTAAAITLSASPEATAQDYKPSDVSKRVRDTCTPDALRLCPFHPLGSNEMVYCMEAKIQNVSRDCGAALEDDGVVPRGHFRKRG